ncbi:MAG: shikimate kinase [Anaerovoracaceae bacterium]
MNFVLIGMPACGKSTIGVVLAKTAGMNFIDTDLLIQQREKMILQDILDARGSEAFLEIEEAVLCGISDENVVISTGGSAVYSEAAMAHLKETGKIIYLSLPLEEIKARLNNIKTRGIAMEVGQTLEDLYEKRIPLYKKYADITIAAEGLSVEECIEEILVQIGR